MSVEQAQSFTCYPEKWSQRWSDIRAVENIECFFNPDDAAFVFCKRIDYYIDSWELRAIGCTIQDCPGLFSSERDSDLVWDIIRRSDVILYIISGDGGSRTEEEKSIEKCRANGVTRRIVFGVNLHKSLQTWDIIKPEVLVQLLRMGFEKPEIIPFHAPLALHCSELFQLLNGELYHLSKRAIQDRIIRSRYKGHTLEMYLRKRIDHWICSLKEKDCFDNYCIGRDIKWRMLDELHRGPMLIEKVERIIEAAVLPRERKALCDRLMTASNALGEISRKLKWGR